MPFREEICSVPKNFHCVGTVVPLRWYKSFTALKKPYHSAGTFGTRQCVFSSRRNAAEAYFTRMCIWAEALPCVAQLAYAMMSQVRDLGRLLQKALAL